MGSRAQKQGREPKKVVYVRKTTVGQDLKEIGQRAGREVGGMLGNAAKALRNRGRQIDKAVDDAS